jgi:hypothetical protein
MYHDPDDTTLHPPIEFLYHRIIPPPRTKYFKLPPCLRFSRHKCVGISFLSHTSYLSCSTHPPAGRLRLKCDGTRAETRFHLSAKWTSPFKSAAASVQSTTGSQVVCSSGSNAGYTTFRGSVKGTGYPTICQFPVHFPSLTSPCAITFKLDFTIFKWRKKRRKGGIKNHYNWELSVFVRPTEQVFRISNNVGNCNWIFSLVGSK